MRTSATFTTVPSSSVMPEPSVAAAITARPAGVPVRTPPEDGPEDGAGEEGLVVTAYRSLARAAASHARGASAPPGSPRSLRSVLVHLPSASDIDAAAARLRGTITSSPLQRSSRLSSLTGLEVWLKREDLQEVRSYKGRGAYNLISQLPG